MSLSKFASFHQAALEGNESVNHPVVRMLTTNRFQHSSVCLHSDPTGKVGFVCVTSDERVCKKQDLEMIGELEWADDLVGPTVPNGTISAVIATDQFKMPPKEFKDLEAGFMIPDNLNTKPCVRSTRKLTSRVSTFHLDYNEFSLMLGVLIEPAFEDEKDSLTEEEHRSAIHKALKEGNKKNEEVIQKMNLRKAPAPAQASLAAPVATIEPMFHQLSKHPYNPVSFNLQLPANTPFRQDSIIYSTFCLYTFSYQFAVTTQQNQIDFYNYDRLGAPQWKYTDCNECLVVLQRLVRHFGYMNPFIRGDHPGCHTAPSTQLHPDSNRLAPNAPFAHEQVLCQFRNNFVFVRPDGYIGTYSYDTTTGIWSPRIPKFVYDGMKINVRQRGIRNPYLETEVITDTTYYVQSRNPQSLPALEAETQRQLLRLAQLAQKPLAMAPLKAHVPHQQTNAQAPASNPETFDPQQLHLLMAQFALTQQFLMPLIEARASQQHTNAQAPASNPGTLAPAAQQQAQACPETPNPAAQQDTNAQAPASNPEALAPARLEAPNSAAKQKFKEPSTVSLHLQPMTAAVGGSAPLQRSETDSQAHAENRAQPNVIAKTQPQVQEAQAKTERKLQIEQLSQEISRLRTRRNELFPSSNQLENTQVPSDIVTKDSAECDLKKQNEDEKKDTENEEEKKARIHQLLRPPQMAYWAVAIDKMMRAAEERAGVLQPKQGSVQLEDKVQAVNENDFKPEEQEDDDEDYDDEEEYEDEEEDEVDEEEDDGDEDEEEEEDDDDEEEEEEEEEEDTEEKEKKEEKASENQMNTILLTDRTQEMIRLTNEIARRTPPTTENRGFSVNSKKASEDKNTMTDRSEVPKIRYQAWLDLCAKRLENPATENFFTRQTIRKLVPHQEETSRSLFFAPAYSTASSSREKKSEDVADKKDTKR